MLNARSLVMIILTGPTGKPSHAMNHIRRVNQETRNEGMGQTEAEAYRFRGFRMKGRSVSRLTIESAYRNLVTSTGGAKGPTPRRLGWVALASTGALRKLKFSCALEHGAPRRALLRLEHFLDLIATRCPELVTVCCGAAGFVMRAWQLATA